ncbi:MAG TPA: trypsin-like peptidase domain-containing protein [Gaiellaceae bacterium]
MLVATAVTAAAVAAGYAFAATRTAQIGTGIVVIDTNLAYQGAQAAGTGMVLTSSGEILTNNHVIRGATTIKVVIPGTGRSYSAKVVGYDVTADVAVLQATGAAHLRTVTRGTSTGLKAGQAVKAIGNAGGSGSLVSSTGTITALSRTIVVNDDAGGTSTLRNLIETNAELEPGDSGGPLLDAAGKVIGMDSAASVGGGGYREIASTDGYAIPINRALAIAKLIAAGKGSATVHVGGTAFLGISSVSAGDAPGYEYAQPGAVVASVVPGSPADKAGLAAGDLIVAVGGKAVTSPTSLQSIVLGRKPGTQIKVTYIDTSGTTETAAATLVSGPAQ